MTSKKLLLKTLLKGIETGDPASAAVVNEEKYIQHNPQTHEGSEGLAVLFARLAKTNPKVTFVRVFEDGDTTLRLFAWPLKCSALRMARRWSTGTIFNR